MPSRLSTGVPRSLWAVEAYLDHAASTPVREEVIQAMMPWLSEHPGNPSGSHRLAREARRAIDDARDHIASLVGAEPGNVIFTSGGTESDNLAIDGTLGIIGGQVLCSATEHPAVLEPVSYTHLTLPTNREV